MLCSRKKALRRCRVSQDRLAERSNQGIVTPKAGKNVLRQDVLDAEKLRAGVVRIGSD
jgi:hypothetical protein